MVLFSKMKSGCYVFDSAEHVRNSEFELKDDTVKKNEKWCYGISYSTTSRDGVKTTTYLYAKTAESRMDWFEAFRRAVNNVAPVGGKCNEYNFDMHTFDMPPPVYCFVCNHILLGQYFQGYFCHRSGLTAHRDCIVRAPPLNMINRTVEWVQIHKVELDELEKSSSYQERTDSNANQQAFWHAAKGILVRAYLSCPPAHDRLSMLTEDVSSSSSSIDPNAFEASWRIRAIYNSEKTFQYWHKSLDVEEECLLNEDEGPPSPLLHFCYNSIILLLGLRLYDNEVWLLGRYGSRIGWFPSSYVSPIKSTDPILNRYTTAFNRYHSTMGSTAYFNGYRDSIQPGNVMNPQQNNVNRSRSSFPLKSADRLIENRLIVRSSSDLPGAACNTSATIPPSSPFKDHVTGNAATLSLLREEPGGVVFRRGSSNNTSHSSSVELDRYYWYVGEMSREDAIYHLSNDKCVDGTFLIRNSSSGGWQSHLSISLKYLGEFKHMRIFTEFNVIDGNNVTSYHLSQLKKFSSVSKLVSYYSVASLGEAYKGLNTSLLYPIGEILAIVPSYPFNSTVFTHPGTIQQESVPTVMRNTLTLDMSVLFRARVRYAFKPTNERHLALRIGDVINVISQAGDDRGWWGGDCNGQLGYFPKDYVERVID